jgi:hypothetical protein
MTHQARPTCYRCRRPARACICATISRVPNRTALLVVQHPRERGHPFGTLRIARLGLSRLTIDVASRDATGRTVSTAKPPLAAALLYPCPSASELSTVPPAERPQALVVLDGTWPQARKLLRDNPWIGSLRRVALHDPPPGRYRIRKAPRPGQISTIEAIVAALEVLEPQTPGFEALLAAFEAMIDHQLELSGEPDAPRCT